MLRIDEEASARFHRWDERARGWPVHPHPVAPEPPFAPVSFVGSAEQPVNDDGAKPGLFTALVWRITDGKNRASTQPAAEEEPQPVRFKRESLVEFPLALPTTFAAKPQEFAQFLASLNHLAEPMAFELVGTSREIFAQLATAPADEARVRRQLHAFFPHIACAPAVDGLDAAMQTVRDGEAAVIEFGLARETVLPLADMQHDLCVPLIGAMGELADGEFALYQVLFQPASHPWAENLIRAVTNADGDARFVNAKELVSAAREKTARLLYSAVVRVAAVALDYPRVTGIIRGLAGALSAFADPNGNELIPLRNDDYPFAVHVEDMLRCQSRHSGMLLNADELAGFIRFPHRRGCLAPLPPPDAKDQSSPVRRHRRDRAFARHEHPRGQNARGAAHAGAACAARAYATPRAAVEAAVSAPRPRAAPAAATPAPEPARPLAAQSAAPAVASVTVPVPPLAPALAVQRPEPPRVREEKVAVQPAADPGRGGAQHKAIQSRIKDAAKTLGFCVGVEKPLPNGMGIVDLVLERDGHAIAVEITITTTIDHEVRNVSKCIKAGYPRIAVIGVDEAKLAGTVANSLGPEASARVSYFLPDAFIAALAHLPPPAPLPPEVKTVRGWKIKTKFTVLPPAETKAREDALIKTVAESMKKSLRKS